MIRKPTVLVLGAGASVPYDFPSGRSLLLQICKNLAAGVPNPLRQHLLDFGFRERRIDAFHEQLRLSMLPSVDAFLENRPEYMEIGKAAIALSLIPYENPEALHRRTEKLEWYEYLFNQMGARRDEFPSNRLSIVTFNYDRSLEYFLFIALKNAYGANNQEVLDLLKSIPIIHVYGQLGKPDFWASDGRAYTQEVNPDAINKCIAEIKIIRELCQESDELTQAQELIKQAKVLCFLGFGYHPTNVQRLRVDETFVGERLLGSAYGLRGAEKRRVRKLFAATIHLFGQDALTFLREGPVFD